MISSILEGWNQVCIPHIYLILRTCFVSSELKSCNVGGYATTDCTRLMTLIMWSMSIKARVNFHSDLISCINQWLYAYVLWRPNPLVWLRIVPSKITERFCFAAFWNKDFNSLMSILSSKLISIRWIMIATTQMKIIPRWG